MKAKMEILRKFVICQSPSPKVIELAYQERQCWEEFSHYGGDEDAAFISHCEWLQQRFFKKAAKIGYCGSIEDAIKYNQEKRDYIYDTSIGVLCHKNYVNLIKPENREI